METFLDALGNHVVSDATERLERDDVVHAITDVTYDVGRQKPAFAKLGCERNQSLYVLRIIIDIGERTEVAELAGCLVYLAQSSAYQRLISALDDEIGHFGATQPHVFLYLYIHKFLQEERGKQRRNHLNAARNDVLLQELVGERIELQEDFAYDSYLRQFSVEGHLVEFFGCLFQESDESFG